MSGGSAVAILANPPDEPLPILTNPPDEPLSSSGFLSASAASLPGGFKTRDGSSQFSKAYRQASSLFLTRRPQEALSALQPLITNTHTSDQSNGGGPSEGAPIASASRGLRIKVWCLYLTILDAVVNLGPEEGKNAFGSQDWRSLVSKAREGKVWDDVVVDGYGGREGGVDAEVVISLSTLLLAHSPSQSLTQQRLENYLSASATPNLDISSRLQAGEFPERIPEPGRRRPSPDGGTDTPRDLNTRIKILELYALHVLPQNEEWDYAREFISLSEVLDEEKREAFLQTLQMLRDERDRNSQMEADFQREQDAQLEREKQDAADRQAEEAAEAAAAAEKAKAEQEQEQKSGTSTSQHKRTSSEVDYGIESSNPSDPAVSSSKPRTNKGGPKSRVPQPSSTRLSPPPRLPSSAGASASASSSLFGRASTMLSSLQKLLSSVAQSTSKSSMVLVRMLLLLIGLVLMLSRSPVRDRVRRIVRVSWGKIAATIGMGVKVSYM
ncbi:hypothetical protein GP486_003339 [Trichoglossum hirsutum]|uniref:Peroxin 26 n=1 Tax=Trichoglossum hirsutum TaxID=265104 RepID=A0A9P8RQS6_9PEZI|nr:hypothetical protein GP486_003339 [Trichoglossum hirsutum]